MEFNRHNEDLPTQEIDICGCENLSDLRNLYEGMKETSRRANLVHRLSRESPDTFSPDLDKILTLESKKESDYKMKLSSEIFKLKENGIIDVVSEMNYVFHCNSCDSYRDILD